MKLWEENPGEDFLVNIFNSIERLFNKHFQSKDMADSLNSQGKLETH